ncbi:MAG: hypothetical protein AVDCRST_MAG49-1690, partial [uncultured Thermomicrobiales bacterium]
ALPRSVPRRGRAHLHRARRRRRRGGGRRGHRHHPRGRDVPSRGVHAPRGALRAAVGGARRRADGVL